MSEFRIIKLSLALFLLLAIMILWIQPLFAPPVDWEVKGMSYASWVVNQYYAPESEESLDNLHGIGANYAALVTAWYMTNLNSSSIYPDSSSSHSFDELRDAIRDIHHRGMKVMLKPHINVQDGTWRAEIAPSDTGAWFNSYRDFITNFAHLAAEENVEIFCMGCEINTMVSNANYTNTWKSIIQDIRNIYSGKLTYAGSACYHNEARIYPYLDYIGINAYFRLENTVTPLIPSLIEDWTNSKSATWMCSEGPALGRNWVQEVSALQASLGKDVLFTELGYQSVDMAGEGPPEKVAGAYNPTGQSNCFEAAFTVWSNKTWLKGAYIWDWFTKPDAGGPGNIKHTPQNKPGEAAIKRWYTGSTITINNIIVNPSRVTNDIARNVQFQADIISDSGPVTNALIFLDNLGGPTQGLRMTNIIGNT